MIYTIGHGNRTWAAFSSLLTKFECGYLIDVRSFPFSRFNGAFNKEELKGHCRLMGIKYVFMGDTLGGRPADTTLYDASGRADYRRIKESTSYGIGIERLRKAATLPTSTFIMCSELNPCECHRSKLIGRTLDEMQIPITHIDKNGNQVTQEVVMAELDGGQGDFFGDATSTTRSRAKYR